MSNLTTVADIRSDILFRAGENPNDTSGKFYSKTLEYINRANINIHLGKSPLDPMSNTVFRWAVSVNPILLILRPKIDTGTVSVTSDQNTITFSSAPASSVVGYHFMVNGTSDVFKISSHTGGNTAATLDSVYTGDTDTDATFKLILVDYTIGSNNIMRLITPIRIHKNLSWVTEFRIDGLEEDAFDKLFPLSRIQSGVPSAFKVLSEVENNWTIQFNRYMAEDIMRLEIPFIDLPTDLTSVDTPRCPREYRSVIADWALSFLLPDKNDTRAENALKLAQSGFSAMVNDIKYRWADIDNDYAQIYARQDELGTDRDDVLRTTSGLIIG